MPIRADVQTRYPNVVIPVKQPPTLRNHESLIGWVESEPLNPDRDREREDDYPRRVKPQHTEGGLRRQHDSQITDSFAA